MAVKKGIRFYPIALFTSVMGVAGVAISFHLMEELFAVKKIVSSFFTILASILFLLNAIIFMYRIVMYKQDVKKDFNHPVKMNFFGAISISLLLLAVLYLQWHETTAFVIWIIGTGLQFILTMLLLSKIIWQKEFKIEQFNPTWIIPIVGNIVVPLAGVEFALPFINWLFFSIGIVFTMLYLTLMIIRLFFYPALPPQLVPTMFIILAPLGVGFTAYFQLVGDIDAIAYIIYGLGFYIGLLFVFQFKRFISLPFFVSWWAYLFPSAAMTNATIYMYTTLQLEFLKWIIYVQVSGLVVLTFLLLYKTIHLAIKGKLMVKEV